MKNFKPYLLSAFFLASHMMVFGQLSDKDLKHFKSNVEFSGVRDGSWKDEDGDKFEVLEINTVQDSDDPINYDMSNFRIRIVVELLDKEKNTYLVRFTGAAPTDYDSEYQGEDFWRLFMAYGDFSRIKISGYIVQYGYMDDENFIVLAEDDKASEKMLEKANQGLTKLFKGKVYLRHQYMYDDSSIGVTESTLTNIKKIKE